MELLGSGERVEREWGVVIERGESGERVGKELGESGVWG